MSQKRTKKTAKKATAKRMPTKPKNRNAGIPMIRIRESYPSSHSFYQEIGSFSTTALIALEQKRIKEGAVSKESFLKGYLEKELKNGSLTEVAIKSFVTLLNESKKAPLNRVVYSSLRVISDEFCYYIQFMEGFKGVDFLTRFENALLELDKLDSWIKTEIVIGDNEIYRGDKNQLIYPKEYKLNYKDGRLLESFYIGAQVKNRDALDQILDLFFNNGILCHHDGVNKGFHSLVICPDNNVPGVAYIPTKKSS